VQRNCLITAVPGLQIPARFRKIAQEELNIAAAVISTLIAMHDDYCAQLAR